MMKLTSDTQCHYTPESGKVPSGEEVFCGVCGDKMGERRNVDGPTGYAESMSGSSHLHDAFVCPYSDEDWHKQAVALRSQANQTPSLKFAEMFREEADQIISSRKATKQGFWP